jgi:hypothetical protein
MLTSENRSGDSGSLGDSHGQLSGFAYYGSRNNGRLSRTNRTTSQQPIPCQCKIQPVGKPASWQNFGRAVSRSAQAGGLLQA